MRKSLATSFFLLTILIDQPASPEECRVMGQTLLVFPFSSTKQSGGGSEAPAVVLPVLLKEYLDLVKGIVLVRGENKNEARYLLKGTVVRSDSNSKAEALLLSSEGKELLRLHGQFSFPSQMNEFLLSWIKEIATAVTGKKLDEKKILPYLNITPSPAAYLSYAQGTLFLEHREYEKAGELFEEAIKQDYNYVPAYLGLAQALAGLGNIARARVELEKAKLLHPPLAKIKERRIEQLIKKGEEPACPE